MSFYNSSPWPTLSQGDLLSGFTIREFTAVKQDNPKLYANKHILVLSHGCEIDKPDTIAFLCAQLRPLTKQNASYQRRIIAGDVVSAFYVPAVGELGDSYVDFRLSHRVAKADLVQGIAEGRRVACLSEDAQLQLHLSLFGYFAHAELPPWIARLAITWTRVRDWFGSRS